MLSIIFFILKLIGIILALIVFLIILVLFVPIRYNIYANYKENIFGEFKVHWLLHFLHFKGVYADENFRMKLKIFGLVVYDSDKVIKSTSEDDLELEKEPKNKKLKNHKKDKNLIKDKNHKKDKISNSNEDIKLDLNSKKDVSSSENGAKNPISNDEANLQNNVNAQKNVNIQKESVSEKILIKKENINQNHDANQNNTENINLIEDTRNENANNKENVFLAKLKLIFRKIGNIILKICNVPKKIKVFFLKIGQKLNQIKDKLLNIKKVIDRIKSAIEKIKLFLQDEVNKDGMKHIFNGLKSILRHIKPKKISGEIEFGAKEPYETGQILAIISMGYGLYGKSFNIYPNFEEEILIGNVKAIGRIRLITFLIIGVKLILYKNNRQLVKNIMVLKEEL